MALLIDLLKSNLAITDSTQDTQLTAILDQATELAADFLQYPVVEQNDTIILDNTCGRPFVACGNISALVSLTIDKQTKDANEYLIGDHNHLMTAAPNYAPVEACLVVAEITRGWVEPYPAWLARAIVLIAEAIYSNQVAGGSFGGPAGTAGPIQRERVNGVREVEYAVEAAPSDGTATNTGTGGLPETAYRLLRPHRCHRV